MFTPELLQELSRRAEVLGKKGINPSFDVLPDSEGGLEWHTGSYEPVNLLARMSGKPEQVISISFLSIGPVFHRYEEYRSEHLGVRSRLKPNDIQALIIQDTGEIRDLSVSRRNTETYAEQIEFAFASMLRVMPTA